MNIKELVNQNIEQVIQDRRWLHQNPELSNEEFETTKLIRKRLTECGVEIVEIGLKTGVVGILRGTKPGKTVAIREDIDALHMPDETDLPFRSQVENKCHACGHDIHTAVLLGCAKVLSLMREELCGNVMFLFQPAEENCSGARQLEACRFWEVLRPDVFVGLHAAPVIPVGSISVKYGVAGASSDPFSIRVTGHGGHGAYPERCIDPIIIAANVITQLQTVISRELYPIQPAVLTVGTIHGGTAKNVIADYVEMGGTLRTLDPVCREQAKAAVERISKMTAQTLRGDAEVIWDTASAPVQINDPAVVDMVVSSAKKIVGAENIYVVENASMGSEDFSVLYPKYGPGMQFNLGTQDPEDPNTALGIHNTRNVFDERCLPIGVSVLVQFTKDYLQNA